MEMGDEEGEEEEEGEEKRMVEGAGDSARYLSPYLVGHFRSSLIVFGIPNSVRFY